MSSEEAIKISKVIPNKSLDDIEDIYYNPDKHPDISSRDLDEAINAYELLQKVFEKYPIIAGTVKKLRGTMKSVGVHPGGVILSGVPLEGNIPMELSTSTSAILPVVSMDMNDVPYWKILKLDVLGSCTLDVIKYTMREAKLGWDWYDSEDYTDQNVFQFLKNGGTKFVFQLSKPMPTSLVKRFGTKSILEIFAVNACNRPGCLMHIDALGKSMSDMFADAVKAIANGEQNPNSFGDSRIDDVLQDTYGAIIYQEQAMALGQVMAGYSLSMTDARVRKILAKKKLKETPGLETEFLYGRLPLKEVWQQKDDKGNIITNGKKEEVVVFENSEGDRILDPDYQKLYDSGYSPVPSEEPSPYNSIGCINNGFAGQMQICKDVFSVLRALASYSFNISHAGAYSVLSYRTAYLSLYYPLEYACAYMRVYDSKEKIRECIKHYRKRGIKVLPPNVNLSDVSFTITKNDKGESDAICFGLSNIHGIGDKVIPAIIEERLNGGNYTSLENFYDRLVGDKTDFIREKYGNKTVASKTIVNQLIKAGAFDDLNPNRYELLNEYNQKLKKDKDYVPYNPQDYKKKALRLQLEFDTLGLYVSEHPLEGFPSADFEQAYNKQKVKFTGIFKKKKTGKIGKGRNKGETYADVTFEVLGGEEMKVKFWNVEYAKYKSVLKDGAYIVIEGKYDTKWNNVVCDSVMELVESQAKEVAEGETVSDEPVNTIENLENLTTPIPTLANPENSFDSFWQSHTG